MAKVYDVLKQLVNVLELGDQTKEFNEIKNIMTSIPNLQTRWTVVEFLQYLTKFSSMHLCHHPNTVKVKDGVTSEKETCSTCGLTRYVFTTHTEEGYGETSTHTSYSDWELPKKG